MKHTTRPSLLAFVVLGLLACGGGSSGADTFPTTDTDVAAPDADTADLPAEDTPDAAKDPGGPDDDTGTETHADVVDPQVQGHLDKGKYWLANAEPWMAKDEFEAALGLLGDSADPAVPGYVDARYGAGLAHLVYGAEQFLMFIQMLPGQAFGFPPPAEGILPPQQTENDYLAGALHTLFNELRAEFAEAHLAFSLMGDAPLAWTIEGVPVYAGVQPMFVFRGTHTRTDLELILAVNDTFLWICDLLVAQDFHTDVMTVISFVLGADNLDVWLILNTLGYLLDQDPRFLQLREEDGRALADDGYARLKGVGTHLIAALDQLDGLTPDESTVAYFDPDKADTLLVKNRVDDTDPDDPVEAPLSMTFPPSVRDAYQRVLDGLSTPGSLVPWDDTLSQLGTLVVAISKSGLLKLFAGDKLPIDLSALEINQAMVVVKNLVPAPVALDWGTFHQHPVGLRALLPKLGYSGGGASASSFLIEWECPDEVAANDGQAGGAAGFICTADATLADAPHFVGTPYEMPADGVTSRLPYLVWDDPTIGGLVFVDPSLVDGALNVEPGWAPADNFTLNLALRGMLDGIINMFVK